MGAPKMRPKDYYTPGEAALALCGRDPSSSHPADIEEIEIWLRDIIDALKKGALPAVKRLDKSVPGSAERRYATLELVPEKDWPGLQGESGGRDWVSTLILGSQLIRWAESTGRLHPSPKVTRKEVKARFGLGDRDIKGLSPVAWEERFNRSDRLKAAKVEGERGKYWAGLVCEYIIDERIASRTEARRRLLPA